MRKHPNMVNNRSMRELIKAHLERGRSISGVEAQALWRCRSLTKRISELAASGMKIAAEWSKDSTGQRYVRYRWEDYDTAR